MTDTPPDLAKLLNQPETIEFEGKAFKLRELTVAQRATYSQWLKDRALSAVELAARTAPEHVAAEQRAGWRQDCAAGVYDFGGPVFSAALRTHAGQVKALHLSLSADHPDLTEDYAEKMWLAHKSQLAALVADKIGDPSFLEAVARLAGRTPSPPSSTRPSRGPKKKSRG